MALVATALVLWGLRLTDGFQASRDLPLWLCDIIFVLCTISMFKPRPIILIFATYWGLAGTLQAMLTPDLLYGFPSKEFLLFFSGHSIILVAISFLLGKYPPAQLTGIKSVVKATLGLLAYTVIVGACDLYFGWNYGYLLYKPHHPSILDKLGPWPFYIPLALLLALGLFVLVAGLLRLSSNLLTNEKKS